MTTVRTAEPLWRRALKQWEPEWVEEWIERAAIIEHDGKLPRNEAEKKAFEMALPNDNELPDDCRSCPMIRINR